VTTDIIAAVICVALLATFGVAAWKLIGSDGDGDRSSGERTGRSDDTGRPGRHEFMAAPTAGTPPAAITDTADDGPFWPAPTTMWDAGLVATMPWLRRQPA
jgi:hypothetical protein